MNRPRLACLAVLLALGGCDVQVHDTTPSSYIAAHGIGMYEITGTAASAGALVTPGSVVMFAVSEGRKLPLDPDQDDSHFRGLYSLRCRDSFPLQLLAVWRLQGLTTAHKFVPEKPRQIHLLEPPPPRSARFLSPGKMPPAGWQGSVPFRFVTVPSARITAAHIEPLSEEPADVAAARALSVATPLPLEGDCGEQLEISVAARAPRAHGALVIATDDPGLRAWRTEVEFAPQ